MNLMDEIIAEIQTRQRSDRTFVIALAGFGGSGKSTLARELAARLGDCLVVPLDDFIIGRAAGRSENWDSYDWSRLEREILAPLKSGERLIRYGSYDWEHDRVNDSKEVAVPRFVIIEGVGLLRESLLSYFDYRLWLDCPLDIAAERGKARDRRDQGVDHDREWDEVWSPNDRDYFAAHHPEGLADRTIPYRAD